MRGPAFLPLASATALSVFSLFLLTLVHTGPIAELALGYVPILLGAVAMWLCWRARKAARHKTAVLLYTIFLAPFAFSYPAWMAFVWAWYAVGGKGPFP